MRQVTNTMNGLQQVTGIEKHGIVETRNDSRNTSNRMKIGDVTVLVDSSTTYFVVVRQTGFHTAETRVWKVEETLSKREAESKAKEIDKVPLSL